jgi:hypothetical protein
MDHIKKRFCGESISEVTLKACASMYRDPFWLHLTLASLDLSRSLSTEALRGLASHRQGSGLIPCGFVHSWLLKRSSLFRCALISDREAAIACLSTLRSNVFMGVELAETFEDGLRHGYLRNTLLLPVLSL